MLSVIFYAIFLSTEISGKKSLILQKLPPKSPATYICLHFFENQNHLLWNIIQLDKVCGKALKEKNWAKWK